MSTTAGLNSDRHVEPEWLDELPADDERAVRSRGDLRRVNTLMGNVAIVARELKRGLAGRSPQSMAEIGAGDGTFMLRLAKRNATRWPGLRVVLVDQQDIVVAETLEALVSLGWKGEAVAADVFEWLARPENEVFDVIVANLFLHHFDAASLTDLLARAAERTRMFVACEPRRSGRALIASRLLGFVGCNDVTRHDAAISVQAGFDGCELSALWPEQRGWILNEHARSLFSHCFVATRVAVRVGGP